MKDEKKYKISELSICNFDFLSIFPTKKGYKHKGYLFCSKQCKDTFINDSKRQNGKIFPIRNFTKFYDCEKTDREL
jgi:hypothetical protein